MQSEIEALLFVVGTDAQANKKIDEFQRDDGADDAPQGHNGGALRNDGGA